MSNELTEQVSDLVSDVYASGYIDGRDGHMDRFSEESLIAVRIIALVRQDERQRIREALLHGDGELMYTFLDAYEEGSFNDGVKAMLQHIGITEGVLTPSPVAREENDDE